MWGKGGGIFSFFSFQRIIRKNFKLFFVGEFLDTFVCNSDIKGATRHPRLLELPRRSQK